MQKAIDILSEASSKVEVIRDAVSHIQEKQINPLSEVSKIETILSTLSKIREKEKPQRSPSDTGTTHPQQTGAEQGLSSDPQQVDILSDDEA